MIIVNIEREYALSEPDCRIVESKNKPVYLAFCRTRPKDCSEVVMNAYTIKNVLKKVFSDLECFKGKLYDQDLRNHVKKEMREDLELGQNLYTRYLELVKEAGLSPLFEQDPQPILEEYEKLLNDDSTPRDERSWNFAVWTKSPSESSDQPIKRVGRETKSTSY